MIQLQFPITNVFTKEVSVKTIVVDTDDIYEAFSKAVDEGHDPSKNIRWKTV